METFVANDDHVLIAIVVEIANEDTGIVCAGSNGQWFAFGGELPAIIQQEPKARVSFADKQIVSAAMIDIDHPDWPVEIFSILKEN